MSIFQMFSSRTRHFKRLKHYLITGFWRRLGFHPVGRKREDMPRKTMVSIIGKVISGHFILKKPISTQELNALIERIRHLGVANVKLKPNSVAQPSTSRSLTRAEGLELLWEHIEFE